MFRRKTVGVGNDSPLLAPASPSLSMLSSQDRDNAFSREKSKSRSTSRSAFKRSSGNAAQEDRTTRTSSLSLFPNGRSRSQPPPEILQSEDSLWAPSSEAELLSEYANLRAMSTKVPLSTTTNYSQIASLIEKPPLSPPMNAHASLPRSFLRNTPHTQTHVPDYDSPFFTNYKLQKQSQQFRSSVQNPPSIPLPSVPGSSSNHDSFSSDQDTLLHLDPTEQRNPHRESASYSSNSSLNRPKTMAAHLQRSNQPDLESPTFYTRRRTVMEVSSVSNPVLITASSNLRVVSREQAQADLSLSRNLSGRKSEKDPRYSLWGFANDSVVTHSTNSHEDGQSRSFVSSNDSRENKTSIITPGQKNGPDYTAAADVESVWKKAAQEAQHQFEDEMRQKRGPLHSKRPDDFSTINTLPAHIFDINSPTFPSSPAFQNSQIPYMQHPEPQQFQQSLHRPIPPFSFPHESNFNQQHSQQPIYDPLSDFRNPDVRQLQQMIQIRQQQQLDHELKLQQQYAEAIKLNAGDFTDNMILPLPAPPPNAPLPPPPLSQIQLPPPPQGPPPPIPQIEKPKKEETNISSVTQEEPDYSSSLIKFPESLDDLHAPLESQKSSVQRNSYNQEQWRITMEAHEQEKQTSPQSRKKSLVTMAKTALFRAVGLKKDKKDSVKKRDGAKSTENSVKSDSVASSPVPMSDGDSSHRGERNSNNSNSSLFKSPLSGELPPQLSNAESVNVEPRNADRTSSPLKDIPLDSATEIVDKLNEENQQTSEGKSGTSELFKIDDLKSHWIWGGEAEQKVEKTADSKEEEKSSDKKADNRKDSQSSASLLSEFSISTTSVVTQTIAEPVLIVSNLHNELNNSAVSASESYKPPELPYVSTTSLLEELPFEWNKNIMDAPSPAATPTPETVQSGLTLELLKQKDKIRPATPETVYYHILDEDLNLPDSPSIGDVVSTPTVDSTFERSGSSLSTSTITDIQIKRTTTFNAFVNVSKETLVLVPSESPPKEVTDAVVIIRDSWLPENGSPDSQWTQKSFDSQGSFLKAYTESVEVEDVEQVSNDEEVGTEMEMDMEIEVGKLDKALQWRKLEYKDWSGDFVVEDESDHVVIGEEKKEDKLNEPNCDENVGENVEENQTENPENEVQSKDKKTIEATEE